MAHTLSQSDIQFILFYTAVAAWWFELTTSRALVQHFNHITIWSNLKYIWRVYRVSRYLLLSSLLLLDISHYYLQCWLHKMMSLVRFQRHWIAATELPFPAKFNEWVTQTRSSQDSKIKEGNEGVFWRRVSAQLGSDLQDDVLKLICWRRVDQTRGLKRCRISQNLITKISEAHIN